MIAAMTERARQGRRTATHVLGYDLLGKDSLMINLEEAEIVRCIFDEYLRKGSLKAVVELCRLKGYRGKRGKEFRSGSIYAILTRPVYSGWNYFRGEVYLGNHPAIIPAETYNEVQRRLLTGRGGPKRKKKTIVLPAEQPLD